MTEQTSLEVIEALRDTLNMLRAAHIQLGMSHDLNKRVIKARAVLAKATGQLPSERAKQ